MGMTDPIADMLTRIRNAARARHESVGMRWSRTKEEIAKIMVAEGFLLEARKTKAKEWSGEELLIQIRFDTTKQPIISGLRRISRPGRRVYVGSKEIPPIRGGLGINILSTSKGILVDREARKANLGGELICSVW